MSSKLMQDFQHQQYVPRCVLSQEEQLVSLARFFSASETLAGVGWHGDVVPSRSSARGRPMSQVLIVDFHSSHLALAPRCVCSCVVNDESAPGFAAVRDGLQLPLDDHVRIELNDARLHVSDILTRHWACHIPQSVQRSCQSGPTTPPKVWIAVVVRLGYLDPEVLPSEELLKSHCWDSWRLGRS